MKVKAYEEAKFLGKSKVMNKADKRDTRIFQGLHLFQPLVWYLQTLEWEPLTVDDAMRGTSWEELAMDFYVATRVPLAKPGRATNGTLKMQADHFRRTAQATAKMMR